MKTNELTGAALDWAVAKCEVEGKPHEITFGTYNGGGVCVHIRPTNPILDGRKMLMEPSTNWVQGGAIIEREGIETCPIGNGEWRGQLNLAGDWIRFYGDTPLIAAMRCYVASKLGDEVELPKEPT